MSDPELYGPQFWPTLHEKPGLYPTAPAECRTCGNYIRSKSFATSEQKQFNPGVKTEIPSSAENQVNVLFIENAGWEHFPPAGDETSFSNGAFGVPHPHGILPHDNRSHRLDWERQHFRWKSRRDGEIYHFTKGMWDIFGDPF
jgi:hypothetical protein